MNRLYKSYVKRLKIMSFTFLVFNFLILSRMFFIQSFQAHDLRNNMYKIGMTKREVRGNRGNIYDRHGESLASTINKYTFWVNANKDFDKNKIASIFSNELKENKEKYIQLLSQKKPYIQLTNAIPRIQCDGILSEIKNIDGLYCDMSSQRHYPYDNLSSQIVGYVDRNYEGQFGIEYEFNSILSGKTSLITYNRAANGKIRKSLRNQKEVVEDGLDVFITIDMQIQSILVDALNRGLKKSGASSANGVIIDPYNGDILAMASIPDFNPNNYEKFSMTTFNNKVISDAYEPGSTFKLISMTAILESGLYNNDDLIDCENGKYQIIATKQFQDHEPHGELSISEIFIHSSNIGIIKAIENIGTGTLYDYARKFGFGIKSGIDLPGETGGILRPYKEWSRLSGPSIAIGQEVSANTLQLALAYSAVANGGYLIAPKIIKNISGKNYLNEDFRSKPIRKVMSKETSVIILQMMENVVNNGTATKAQIPGFRIGGKTGTAEKYINGKYSKKKFISSFAAIFPIDNPRYVCIISVDSPLYGYHWGNETAAPIVKEIFQRLIINKDMDLKKMSSSYNYASN